MFPAVLVIFCSVLWYTDGLWNPFTRTPYRSLKSSLVMSALSSTELLANVQKAIELHKTGAIGQAISQYELVLPYLSGKTKASLSGNVGSLYMSQGDYERAKEHFTAAVEADGTNPSAHFNLAVVLTTNLNQHAKAIKHCGIAMKMDPDNHKAHHLMGNIMQSIGRPEEAERYFVAAENLALQSKEAVAVNNAHILERLEIFGTKAGQLFRVEVEGVLYEVECISETPLIFIVESFVTPDECEHIKSRSSDLLQKSYVMGGGGEGYEASASNTEDTSSTLAQRDSATSMEKIDPTLYRSSYNAWLPQDTTLDKLQGRLSKILGIPTAYLKQKSEQLQVVRYTPGGQFKVHQDSSAFNTRLVTALLYLNTPMEGLSGGETWFPYAQSNRGTSALSNSGTTVDEAVKTALQSYEASKTLLGLKVAPTLGTAVIFFNHLRTGAIDPLAVHAGLPLRIDGDTATVSGEGEKWVANYWIEYDPVVLEQQFA